MYTHPSNTARDGKITSDTENHEKHYEVEPCEDQFGSAKKTWKSPAFLPSRYLTNIG